MKYVTNNVICNYKYIGPLKSHTGALFCVKGKQRDSSSTCSDIGVAICLSFKAKVINLWQLPQTALT